MLHYSLKLFWKDPPPLPLGRHKKYQKQKLDDVAWKELGVEPFTDTIDHVTEFSAICAIELWRRQKQIFMLTSY